MNPQTLPTLLDGYGGNAPCLPRIVLTGPTQWPRRFIHPPTFRWQEVPAAAAYRVVLWGPQDVALDVTVTTAAVSLAVAWANLAVGMCRLLILALDPAGRLLASSTTLSFHKAAGWPGRPAGLRYTYAETAHRIVTWLLSDCGEGRFDTSVPPYFWHCALSAVDNSVTENNRAFPSLHNPLGVQAFLAYAQRGQDPHLRGVALDRARALADFTIAHSTPASFHYPFLPYHTISQGRLGLHGAHRSQLQQVVEPNKAGHMGVAYLDLYEVTQQTAYQDAAIRLAETLVARQQADGSWPYRVDAQTGYTEETYTSTGVFALLLFDRLRTLPDSSHYQAAYERILAWLLEHPVRTFRWENIFDDMAYSTPYANTGNYDALFMGRFLLDHAADDSTFVPLAEELFCWVDDNFVLYAGDAHVPYHPYTPSVAEQWHYYWPMDVHTANWLLFLLRLWEVTGKEEYRRRAVAAANVVTQCQMLDGRSMSYVPDVDTGMRGHKGADDWYGCMFLPVTAMIEAAAKLTGA